MSTPWPATEDVLVAAQQELASAHPEPWRPGAAPAVAGCFVCFQRGRAGPGAAGDPGWAAAALLDAAGTSIAVIHERAPAPYLPGLLALRDGPLLEKAVRRLPARPDVLLVNATGRDHPRRAGLALHLGAVLDVPTIGVTTEPLLARGDHPAEAPGSQSVLRIAEEVVACWLRLRRGVRPLVVHPGWRTDLDRGRRRDRGHARRAHAGADPPGPAGGARGARRRDDQRLGFLFPMVTLEPGTM